MSLSEKGLVIGPRVPQGLAPVVEGLAREILRHRPEDIYTFAAHHFEQLIELRENERASTRVSKILGRASSNGKCGMLVDWRIGGGNHRADGDSNHDRCGFFDRKANDSMDEAVMKETIGISRATLTKLLTRGRRRRRRASGEEAATNRNGWSINETVKVFKKHGYENKANKGDKETTLRNTQRSKISIEEEIHSYPEQRPPRFSRTAALRRCHRSLSVEDVYLTKNNSRRFKENQLGSWNRRSNELHGTKSQLENSTKNTENASIGCLKRQKSVGQIEEACTSLSRIDRDRASVEYGSVSSALTRRTRSLVNVISNGSNGYGSYSRASTGKEEIRRDRLKETETETETDNNPNRISQNRQGRSEESFRRRGIEPKQRKKSEEDKEKEEEEEEEEEEEQGCRVTGKSNMKPEVDEPESRDNGEMRETFEYESWCDSEGIDIVASTKVSADESKLLAREDTPDITRNQKNSLENEETVILPSVITKQSSSNRYSENIAEQSENNTNYVILPPISVDASKPIKKEDNLVLPVLSKLSEVIDSEQGSLKLSGDSEASSIGDGRKHLELDPSISKAQMLEVSDCDCDSDSDYPPTKVVHEICSCDTANTNRYENVQQILKENDTIVDRATDNDEGSEANLEMNVHREDSLIIKSDFGEVSQKLVKSLDCLNADSGNEDENGEENSTTMTTVTGGDGHEEERKEQRNIGERETCPVGNDELKNKLIEIEAVERSIESTLISSETVLIADDDRKSVTSCSIDCTSNSESDESERLKVLFGNNVDSIATEMLHAARAKQDSLYNLYNYSLGSDNVDMATRDSRNQLNLTDNSTAPATTIPVNASIEAEAEADGVTMETVMIGMDAEQLTQPQPQPQPQHARAALDAPDDRHRVSSNFSKDVDSNCYVLTEGSPCEIPESVTIVIIPDKDTGFRSDNDTFRMEHELDEQKANPFGEYIVHPMEELRCSSQQFDHRTNNHRVDLLRDIREEEESEKDGLEENVQDENAVDCDAALDQPNRNASGTTRAKDTCIPVEHAATEDSDHANREHGEHGEHGEQAEATLKDRTSEQYLLSGMVEPCVSGLNLHSFRDAAVSSNENRNDSRNSDNRSEKEIDLDNVRETETIFSSFDTILPDRKPTIDESPLSNNNHFQCEKERVANRRESREGSSNVEEDIARELIENLTDGTLRLEETTNTTAFEAANCFNAKSDTPSEHGAVFTFSSSDVSKNQDQSEQSNQLVINSNLGNDALDAAIRVIQFRVREFLFRRRVSKKSDQERNDEQNSLDASLILKECGKNVAISNDRYCGGRGCRDSDAFISKTINEAGSSSINKDILEEHGSCISNELRHTGEFHDSLPLPLPSPSPSPSPSPFPVYEISKDEMSSVDATIHKLERIQENAMKPLLSLKPDTSSFDFKSPETCVLLAFDSGFDFPKSLQLIGDASVWSKTSVNLSSCIEHHFDMNKSTADGFAGESGSDPDIDDIREPLALDKISKTILIEEILTDDEEEKEHVLSLIDTVVPKSRNEQATVWLKEGRKEGRKKPFVMLRDNNEDSMKASVAATKIQANFRGYRVRKRFRESLTDGNSQPSNVHGHECGREKTRNERVQEIAESSILKKGNIENVSLEEKSATKIQAGVRGFLVRKRQEAAREAATKIQAGFRGFKTRKLLKENEQ